MAVVFGQLSYRREKETMGYDGRGFGRTKVELQVKGDSWLKSR